MVSRLSVYLSVALAAIVPLSFWGRCEDVFFLPWRAALWVYLAPLLFLVAARAAKGWRPAFPSAFAPWVLLALWALFSCFLSRNPADGLRRAVELAGCIACVGAGYAAASRAAMAVSAVLWSVSIISLYGILQAAGMDFLPWTMKFGARAFGTLGNPDYYAGHLLLAIPLCAAAWMKGQRYALLAAGALAGMTAGFVLAQVRGAWLAALAAGLWAAFWIRRGGNLAEKERARLKTAAGVAAVIAVGIFAASAEVRGRAASIFHFTGYDATGRRYLWQIAAQMWSERPWLGFGAGSFKFEFPRFQHLGSTMSMPQFLSYNYSEHAHNEILQIGAELGVLGAGFFLLGLAVWFFWWRLGLKDILARGDRGGWWIQIGIGTGIAGSFVYSFVNFPVQIVPTAATLFFLMGLSLALAGAGSKAWRPPGPLLAAAAGLGCVLGFGAAIMVCADLTGNVYLKELRGRLMLGDFSRAGGAGSKAEMLVGWDFRLHRYLTRLGIVTKDEELAERGISARLRLHPFFVEPLADRAELSESLGRIEEAKERYGVLLEKAPNFSSGWGALGRISFGEGDYQKAVGYFREALNHQPGNAVWEHNLASAYGMLKMYKDALEADARAIENDPGFVDAYVGFALSARALGYRDQAREAARKAYLLAPNDRRVKSLIRQLY